jgi:hypothetical protein
MLTNDAMRQPSTLSQTGGSATIYGYGNISLPVNVVSETNHGPAGELLTVSAQCRQQTLGRTAGRNAELDQGVFRSDHSRVVTNSRSKSS